MAGVKGPLMSLKAKGSIGKTLTFASWKGIHVTKTHSSPANPRSNKQLQIRAVFANLQAIDKAIGIDGRQTWLRQATSSPTTSSNLLQRANLSTLYRQHDLALFVASKAGQNAPPQAPAVLTPAPTAISILATAATPPPDWQVLGVIVLFIQDFDPLTKQTPLPLLIQSSPTASPATFNYSGLDAAQLYHTYTYTELEDDQGQRVYSASAHASASTP